MSDETEEYIDESPCNNCGEPWCDICAYRREQAVAANPCPSCNGSGLGLSTNTGEVQPRVWVGGVTDSPPFWKWEYGEWCRSPGKSWYIVNGVIFVPGHHPKPTIDPSKMTTIETCKEIWND